MNFTIKLALIISGLGLLGIGTDEEPGWLAEALAGTDQDVEAAVDAYAAEDYDAANTALDAAIARRGERSELFYDRGLISIATGDLDGARALFQHGTTSDKPQVRASSYYQLGNLALASEDWQAAIDGFTETLRVEPDHQNAKWNLELALQRKREQEEREKQEQEEQDKQEEQDEQDKQDGEDGEDGEQGEQDEQEGEQDQPKDGEDGEDGEQGEQDQPKPEQGDEQGEQEPEQPEPEPEQNGEQDQPEPSEQEAQAQPVEAGEVDSALEELDRQDAFMFGRPRGSQRKVEKDW